LLASVARILYPNGVPRMRLAPGMPWTVIPWAKTGFFEQIMPELTGLQRE